MSLESVIVLLALAVFLAVQPWSVLAGILLVTSHRGVTKELAFVAGWVSILVVVAAATVALYPELPRTASAQTAHGGLSLALGLALAGWLWWRRRRPQPVTRRAEPKWLGRLDDMSPWLAFGLGVFLPTYAVVVAAMNELLTSNVTQATLIVTALVWISLATVGVAAPLGVLVVDGDAAPARYAGWREWILGHSSAVTFLVGIVVSVLLIGKGIAGLIG